MKRNIGKKDARQIRRLLRETITAAKMEHAMFDNLQGIDTVVKAQEVTQFIKDKTRLYRQSWIISRLEEALEIIGEVGL